MRRPNHGTIAAYLALFIALGGTSYAAVTLPRSSVGNPQLKDNAVTSGKIRNGTLLARDFRGGVLQSGPRGATGERGPAGATGPAGPAGTARAWGRVDTAGSLTRSNGAVTVTRVSNGVFCITPTAASGINAGTTGVVATIDPNGTAQNQDKDEVVKYNTATNTGCPAGSFTVETYLNDSSNTTSVGGDPAPRFTHRLSDAGFFFVIP